MQCFVYPERPAAGICRACGRGVCVEQCAHDGGVALSCSDACARQIDIAQSLTRRARATYGNAARNIWLGPAFFATMGVVFLWFGWHDGFKFGTAMGVLFIVFAGLMAWRNRRWAQLIR